MTHSGHYWWPSLVFLNSSHQNLFYGIKDAIIKALLYLWGLILYFFLFFSFLFFPHWNLCLTMSVTHSGHCWWHSLMSLDLSHWDLFNDTGMLSSELQLPRYHSFFLSFLFFSLLYSPWNLYQLILTVSLKYRYSQLWLFKMSLFSATTFTKLFYFAKKNQLILVCYYFFFKHY